MRQLIQLSSSLIENLRFAALEDIDDYMVQRDILFEELQLLNPTAEQRIQLKSLADEVQQQDAIIVGRMMQLREEASREIDKLNKGKRSKSMYEASGYGDDSLFFDRKQ